MSEHMWSRCKYIALNGGNKPQRSQQLAAVTEPNVIGCRRRSLMTCTFDRRSLAGRHEMMASAMQYLRS